MFGDWVINLIRLDNKHVYRLTNLLRGLQTSVISMKIYQYFVNHTDGPSNTIIFCDLNKVI